MGHIVEKAEWVEDLYRIQISDPVKGDDGVINVQPAQLTWRTGFLKDLMLTEHNEAGQHRIANQHISDQAGIEAKKLVLDVPLEDIDQRTKDLIPSIATLQTNLQDVITTGSGIADDLLSSLLIIWRYADFGFDMEFFLDQATLLPSLSCASFNAIAYDDSLDVEDNSHLSPGLKMFIQDDQHSEEIEIWKVLDRGRVRLKQDLQYTYNDACTTIGFTTWQINNSSASVKYGQIYYSALCYSCQKSPQGHLIIRTKDTDTELSVYYRHSDVDNSWTKASLVNKTSLVDGTADWHYYVEGGILQLKLQGSAASHTVYFIALFPVPSEHVYSSIRKPVLHYPWNNSTILRDDFCFQASKFRCIYRDNFVQNEFVLCHPLTDEIINIYSSPNQDALVIASPNLPPDGIYTAKCRQLTDIGEYSEWSVMNTFNLIAGIFNFGFQGAEFAAALNEKSLDTIKKTNIRFGFLGTEISRGFDCCLFTNNME